MDRNLYINDLGVFDSKFKYEVLYKDGDIEVSAELGEYAFIHLKMETITKAKYRHYLKVWDDVQSELKDMGYVCVFCMIPNHYNLSEKAEKMFGWKKLQDEDVLTLFVKDL